MRRQFVIILNYKNENVEWDVISHDVLVADDLLSLLNQFNVLILGMHKRILREDGKLIEEWE